jgi:hypothetical protein
MALRLSNSTSVISLSTLTNLSAGSAPLGVTTISDNRGFEIVWAPAQSQNPYDCKGFASFRVWSLLVLTLTGAAAISIGKSIGTQIV